VGAGEDVVETGWGWVGMGVIFIPVQVCPAQYSPSGAIVHSNLQCLPPPKTSTSYFLNGSVKNQPIGMSFSTENSEEILHSCFFYSVYHT